MVVIARITLRVTLSLFISLFSALWNLCNENSLLLYYWKIISRWNKMCVFQKTLALLERSGFRKIPKIFCLVKKGLSLSMNFKYSVCWEKPSALEREDQKKTPGQKSAALLAPPGGCEWLRSLAFQSLPSEGTANAPLHVLAPGKPLRPAEKPSPRQRFKSLFHKFNQGFSWFQKTTIQLFFPLLSFNSETFLSVDFHELLPNTRCKLKNSHWPISA